ncbi:hypothetical protein AKJ09_06082 [Labilithrix luteola]|uniref:Type IV fimbrial biogenesis protein PilW n=1 Tax=Labilithrix luteola TaxID=1391654 RepID=A0A0K1Q0V5_9BACT|nr:prepilin-type N-terminal cleavage/methylation domain-containing protein [Labilithrix luteola]AKU99418.1 hypothetical protein AKJ09_06082 [Labilithrix luteola]
MIRTRMRRFVIARVARAARENRRQQRGFTLPELMVSLVAGLIVTMAVVALAKTSTNTFHEQVRTTSAEMALRLAASRLTSDLTRASFMSTGNIRWDPGIARDRTAPDPATDTGSRYTALNNLAGLRLYRAASPEAPSLPIAASNGLRPQALDITGNLTSNDQYLGTIGPGTIGPQRFTLNNDDPTVMRMLLMPDGATPRSDAEATAILSETFLPVAGRTFPARVTDTSGKTHFVVVAAAGVAGGQAWLDLANSNLGTPVLSAQDTGQKGGFEGFEQLQIAPLQTVRWSIQRVANPRLDPDVDANAKYDLFRQYIDATGALVGSPELVSEYAVDLRFAFTVDQSPLLPLNTGFDFEDDENNQRWTTSTGVSSGTASTPGPHRIRSVRFRLATRAAMPDRKLNLPGPADGFLYRYCIDEVALAACTRFARVRTLVSEVALTNQARMNY